MGIKEKQDFINFWEFLEIPMNSPIRNIKVAFLVKLSKIEESIDKEQSNYTLNDLKTCINAYETLSDPYKRYLHNCEIDGEEPQKNPNWDEFLNNNGITDCDLNDEDNEKFLFMLFEKTKKYKNKANLADELNDTIKLYMEIAIKLCNLYNNEQEKQLQKETKRKLQPKTIHK